MTNDIFQLTFQGSKGQLAATLVQPQSADTIVILLHGLLSNRQFHFFKRLTKQLSLNNIAALRFDFNGHGDSDGLLQDMTVENELLDAQAVLDQVKQYVWVKHIILVGYSLGGVVAGLLAAKNNSCIDALVQVAAAAVMHDDALSGKLMNATYDPNNIPDFVRVFFVKKIGKAYLEAARDIDIYSHTCSYAGPVCLIHGTNDSIVPYHYSELYQQQYPHALLHLLDNENHLLLHNPNKVVQIILQFIQSYQNYNL